MTDQCLFGELPLQEAKKRPAVAGDPRLLEPERDGVELRASSLDSLIGADHPARLIWAYVVELDLRELEARVKAREGVAGRPAISPRLLLGLWLYATSEGVVSARLLERLCERDDAYRWLCGGVGVNHRTLGEFRVDHGALLDRLLAQSVTALAVEGLIDLDALSQDGVRVRASAGASSFHQRGTLEQQVVEVEAVVAELAKQVDSDPSQNERQVRDRRARRAAERLSRLKAAVAKVAELEDKRAKAKPPEAKADAPPKPDKQPKPPRASSTDVDARVIKMADGGFRPAYNMQIASVAGGQIVVAVDVSTSSSDRGLARPMLEQIEATYGMLPSKHLIDGGFTKNDDIEWAHDANVTMYCPPTTNKHKTDPFEPREDDGPGVAQWRERMKSEAGQAIYRLRAIHECINARFRQWGLAQLTVRGKAKAIVVLTWYALVNNLLQGERLRRAAAARNRPLAGVV
ncbi:MAG: IS1182 family transposase [Reyranellaceae bacterium]